MNWTTSTHPISDIRDWKRSDRLELQPDFQRNVVWTKAAQISLIDTILNNIPIPKIYIKAVIKDEETYRIVVDGQQRLTAILEFVNNQLKLRKPYCTKYDGLTFQELSEEIRNEILSYQVDFNEIRNPTDDDVRDLYRRVNKYTVQLNKQELRRADFPGDFINLAEEFSDEAFFAENRIFSAGQKRRMLDVEYIEELFCILLEGEQDKKDTLDEFCEKYAHFSEGMDEVKASFNKILSDISQLFSQALFLGNTRFRQHADFYSLFSCINIYISKGKKIREENLLSVRENLLLLDREIAPHSENEGFSAYAIRCISDANSLATRRWRRDFLMKYIAPLYLSDLELQEANQ